MKNRNKLVIRLSDEKDSYFEILFGNKYDENNELYSRVYSNEFNEIMQKMSSAVETFNGILFKKDFYLVLTAILINESLTYCERKDLTTNKVYKLEEFLKQLIEEE